MKFSLRRSLPALLAMAFSFLPPGTMRAAEFDQRVINLSTRAQVGTGASVMITGFFVGDGPAKKILIRAVGPGLQSYGVSSPLADPVIALYSSSGALLTSNDNWATSDAATMASVGAFPLTPGSRDATLVATLAPGLYSAQVSGAGGSTGVALLEVYDVSGPARLLNLSTRAIVGSGDATLIAGLAVASGGSRRILLRAAGPALADLQVVGAHADPALAVIDSTGRQLSANDNWGSAAASGPLAAAFAQAGAFPFRDGSKDAALVFDLAPGNYSVQVSSVGTASGVALVEVYDLTANAGTPTVSVSASTPITDMQSGAPGVFTVTRDGATSQPLVVSYTVSGTAVAGTDYRPLSGSVTVPAGVPSASVALTPLVNPQNTDNRTVTLTVTPTPGLTLGNATASVAIFANPGTLFVAYLRTTVSDSTGSGTALIQVTPDEKAAFVSIGFTNLTSPEVSGHLVLDGNFVFGFPIGQVSGAYWTFAPTGTYSTADLVAALKAGRITVSIDSSKHPAGELAGTFIRNSAGPFIAPAAAPAIDLAIITPRDAARFLIQATFGPTQNDITDLVKKGYAAWFNEQFALPAKPHRNNTMLDFAAYNLGGQGVPVNGIFPFPGGIHRQSAWWGIVLTSPDQLRQRVAFALSQIFVTSDQDASLNTWQEGMASYYDVLVENAFGNFRTLLEQTTLHPIMGVYLSSLRNGRGGVDPNGFAITAPDENFAREIMQLFTIGLNETNPDGTLKLDAKGQLVPTYDQTTIVETAKVFTGWAFSSTDGNRDFRLTGGDKPRDWTLPMILYPAFHEDTAKTIIGGKVLPAGQGGTQDLKDTLDALFNHPNTGPFISRQLIQRLVTSNPSPAYVYRVAQVFANNGSGTRGDLGAVVRAILLDYEARSTAVVTAPGFGKLKEPILRATALYRAFGAKSDSGRFNLDAYPELQQASLRAPTVFNFYTPDFTRPGPLSAAGLVSPEFEILTDTTAITMANYYYFAIYNPKPAIPSVDNSQAVYLTFDSLIPLARNPVGLVAQLDLIITGNALTQPTRDRLVAALNALPASADDFERVRTATFLVVACPEGASQK